MRNLDETNMRNQDRYPCKQSKNGHKINTKSVLKCDESYKYLKTVADPSETFMYARQQTDALTPSATNGTPRLSVLARNEGAFPASAKEYNVRDAIYKSEFDAEITKIRIQPFKNPGRPRNVSIRLVEI